MAAVTGAATFSIGRRSATDGGHPPMVDLRRAAKALGAEAVPLVQELLRSRPAPDIEPFDTVRLVMAGIAQRRDDSPA
jgi:hypothetical protein